MGTIASDPRLDYAYDIQERYVQGAARVAYEGFSSGGSSGSPVFAIQKGFRTGVGIDAPPDFFREVKLIGINAGHFGMTVSTDSESEDTENVVGEEKDQKRKQVICSAEKKDANTSGVVGHSGISYFYKSSVVLEMINKLY